MESQTIVRTRRLVYLFFVIIVLLVIQNNIINNELVESQKNVKLLSNNIVNINNYNTKLENKNNSLIMQVEDKNDTIREKDNKISQLQEELDEYKSSSSVPSYSIPTNDINITNIDSIKLEYSKPYCVSDNPLTASKGVVYFNGHKETYYSEHVLHGGGLNIPGRHVADDGTIRDENGYIVISSDLSFASRGSILMTSLGPAKVYDTGCAYGTLDIYVSW